MAYNSTIPQATDKLLTSQQQMLANFGSLQTTFNVDHYGFNTPTVAADIGKHKTITTPAESAAPSAAASEPVMFALDLGTLGVVQLSRSEDTAGSPTTSKAAGLTALHGEIATAATTDILDCTSLNQCILECYAYGDSGNYARGSILWDPSGSGAFKGQSGTFFGDRNQSSGAFAWQISSKTIQLNHSLSTGTNVVWTIHIRRYDV